MVLTVIKDILIAWGATVAFCVVFLSLIAAYRRLVRPRFQGVTESGKQPT